MILRWLFLMSLMSLAAAETGPFSVPIRMKAGKAYVSDAALAGAGIAVKTMPGQAKLVVCAGERCALFSDYFQEGEERWLALAPIGERLNVGVSLDASNQAARLQMPSSQGAEAEGTAEVGGLAPDFRLTLLDGTPVRLSDFQGKRVLLQSWASW